MRCHCSQQKASRKKESVTTVGLEVIQGIIGQVGKGAVATETGLPIG